MAASNKPKTVLDHKLVECPVCYEIPEAEIYQCRNGHSVCGACAEAVDTCPQCRDPWEANGKIRNLCMESIIAEMQVGCRNKGYGCKVKVARKDLAAHLEHHCGYVPVNLCKILGFTTCNFLSYPEADIHAHFVETHKVGIRKLQRCTNGGGEGFHCSKTLKKTLGHMKVGGAENRKTISYLEYRGEQMDALICLRVNVELEELSVFCLYLEGDQLPQVDIEIRASKRNARWSWAGEGISYRKAAHAMRYPPLKISIPYLLEVLGEDDELVLDFGITYYD